MKEFNNLFSSYYLAPIEYYVYLTQHKEINKDFYEHFVKQTYRNRCYILSPNGVQILSVPVIKAKKRKLIKDVKIAYQDNWQKIHWKSLEAAYRSSPYFEFYEDEFYPFFHQKKYDYLIDFNWALEAKIINLLKIDANILKTTTYIQPSQTDNDYRNLVFGQNKSHFKFKKYIQVFGDRNGFAPNLSIVDLLFNEGPNAINYINGLKQ